MIIKKVNIKRLRAIKQERTFEFTPGLNVIKGNDNEAGKSSLRIAITQALFQDPSTPDEDSRNLTSWGADEPWEISLDLEDSSGSYRITKSLKERTCELIGTGARVFVARNINTISERIIELTGCPSAVFFESTACIGQDELIRIIPSYTNLSEKQGTLGTISKRMQSQLSGLQGMDIASILSQLYNDANQKNAGGPYSHLEEIKEKIYQLRSRKIEEEKKINDIIKNRQKLYQVKEELAELNQRLPEKLDRLNKNNRISELRRETALYKSQYTNYQKAREIKSEMLRIEDELLAFSSFSVGTEKIHQINSFNVDTDSLANQKASLGNECASLEKHEPPIWILVTGLALIVVSASIGTMVSPYLWSIAVTGILLVLYWAATNNSWKKQTEKLKQKIAQIEEKQKDIADEMKRLLTYFGNKDYSSFLERLSEYHSKVEAKRDLANKLDMLLDGEEWKTYAERNSELDKSMSSQLREIEQLRLNLLEPVNIQELEGEIKELEMRKDSLEREKGGLEKYFGYTNTDKDHMAEIVEELFELEEQKKYWERKREVYNTTHKILEDAQKQTFSRASDILEKEIGRYITLITDGKYNRVKINETDMSIQTMSPEKGDWVDVCFLSRATQDQFYICARFALAKLITEGKRPPFLLDDPFVNFHAKRLRQTIPLIKEISKENQILLFTCSDTYDYLGNVINLG